MRADICVLCPFGLDKGLLSKAVSMVSESHVHVLIPESDTSDAIECGAEFIHTINKSPANENIIVPWIANKLKDWDCTIILATATVQMRNIMPILAWHLNAGLTADCTDLTIDGSTLLQTRPAFGNSLMATIRTLSKIQMATVRCGTFQFQRKPALDPQIICEDFHFSENLTCNQAIQDYPDGTPLSNAQIVIAGGLGVGSKQGFEKLERLAKMIGGCIAASRNAVDAGFAPYRRQVGMTGITICPKVYIAVGISGAVQHLAGMSGSDRIIAINSDPKSPIFDYADYGIVSDWEPVIDKLLEELS